MNVPDLNRPGFLVRQLKRKDLPSWYAYLSLKEVYEGTSWDLSSVSDLEPLLLEYCSERKDTALRFAVVDDQSDLLVGTIGFHSISDVNRTAEIAYDLSPAYWGKGIASAMCNALTNWGFLNLGLIRIQATVLESNVRSETVLLNCGYAFEGLLRSYRMVRGVPGDFKMYARLAAYVG
jgi:ribosomal-protein-alanine N-acetyltransferase